jgi:hypothetical protein
MKRDRCRMSSIVHNGETYHGISVDGRGVFTRQDGRRRRTYAGQHRDGYACGLGALTDWCKEYGEHGPDGQWDGRKVERTAGGPTYYYMFERGKYMSSAWVQPEYGECAYEYQLCAPDDPRVLAQIAQVAPVEVRPAAPAAHP